MSAIELAQRSPTSTRRGPHTHAVRAPPVVGSPAPLSVLGSLAAEPEPHVSVPIWTSAVNAVRGPSTRQVGPRRRFESSSCRSASFGAEPVEHGYHRDTG